MTLLAVLAVGTFVRTQRALKSFNSSREANEWVILICTKKAHYQLHLQLLKTKWNTCCFRQQKGSWWMGPNLATLFWRYFGTQDRKSHYNLSLGINSICINVKHFQLYHEIPNLLPKSISSLGLMVEPFLSLLKKKYASLSTMGKVWPSDWM